MSSNSSIKRARVKAALTRRLEARSEGRTEHVASARIAKAFEAEARGIHLSPWHLAQVGRLAKKGRDYPL